MNRCKLSNYQASNKRERIDPGSKTESSQSEAFSESLVFCHDANDINDNHDFRLIIPKQLVREEKSIDANQLRTQVNSVAAHLFVNPKRVNTRSAKSLMIAALM